MAHRHWRRAVGRGWAVLAALWGLAEAVVFFIVPDVLITAVAAARGTRAGVAAAGGAVVGALVGGAALYLWGRSDPEAAMALVDGVPGIGPTMIAGVRDGLATHGPAAMLAGAFSGVPYKIYAAAASAAGIGPAGFLLASVPARLARFVLVALLVGGLARATGRWLSVPVRLALLALFWVVFYAAYFAAVGG